MVGAKIKDVDLLRKESDIFLHINEKLSRQLLRAFDNHAKRSTGARKFQWVQKIEKGRFTTRLYR